MNGESKPNAFKNFFEKNRNCSHLKKKRVIWPTLIFISFFVIYAIGHSIALEEISIWTFECNEGHCERALRNVTVERCALHLTPPYPSLEVCRLVCGKFGAVWPMPTGDINLGSNIKHIYPDKITLQANTSNNSFLTDIFEIFRDNIAKECLNKNCSEPEDTQVFVKIKVLSSNTTLNMTTDESYNLIVQPKNSDDINVKIEANTVFGARHALESLSQLIAPLKFSTPECGKVSALAMVVNANITDKPMYPHRGLLLDTARNYLSVDTIKKQIDALGASKMNVLHWHATDSQSFPFESKNVPQMTTYGAYSQDQVYTKDDTTDILSYAKLRGVRVVLEIDGPAHAGNGWQWGPEQGLGNLSLCMNQKPWKQFCSQPPCGQLNPVNKNVYKILGELYGDVIELFPKGEIFHMGGDDVWYPCWDSSEEIKEYLVSQGKKLDLEKKFGSVEMEIDKQSYLDLLGYFYNQSLKAFDGKAGNNATPIVVWSNDLTDPKVITKYLAKDRYIIQPLVSQKDPILKQLLELGYSLIVSPKDWSLDHGFWSSTKYHFWSVIYNNKIPIHENVLGGEICSWGEYIDDDGIDSRIWPRAAAAGERLWANPETDHIDAEPRFQRHRDRLSKRGIEAQIVVPDWCYYNEGQCI